MLPDFPVQKEKLSKHWNDFFVRRVREHLGFFDTIPSYAHHEGDRSSVIREDGSISRSPGYEVAEGEFSVQLDEIPTLTPDKIAGKVDAAADEMASQMVQTLLREIDREIEAAGRTTDARARPFSKDLFLEALESIELSFDRDGNLQPPSIIMHPNLWDAIKDEVATWEQDSDFTERHNRLLARKREAWHARESRRKLVD